MSLVELYPKTRIEGSDITPPTADSVEGDRAALVDLYNATTAINGLLFWLSDKP